VCWIITAILQTSFLSLSFYSILTFVFFLFPVPFPFLFVFFYLFIFIFLSSVLSSSLPFPPTHYFFSLHKLYSVLFWPRSSTLSHFQCWRHSLQCTLLSTHFNSISNMYLQYSSFFSAEQIYDEYQSLSVFKVMWSGTLPLQRNFTSAARVLVMCLYSFK
jgi:hypothetical protein